jgi:hypothetical protein
MRTEPTLTTTHTPLPANAAFTAGRAVTLHALRARYRETREFFTPMEMVRLRFLRWLYETGRLMP